LVPGVVAALDGIDAIAALLESQDNDVT
jgi:hypothetical protein